MITSKEKHSPPRAKSILNRPYLSAILVKLSVIFYSAGAQLDLNVLNRASLATFLRKEDPEKISENDQRIFDLAEAIRYLATDLDALFLRFLQVGYYPEPETSEITARYKTSQTKLQWQRNWTKAYEPYYDNFLASESTVIAAVEEYLERYCETVDPSQLKSDCDFLEELDVSTSKWWRRNVLARSEVMSRELADYYLKVVEDPELRKWIEERVASDDVKAEPKKLIFDIVEKRGWNDSMIQSLSKLSTEEYTQWLSSDGSQDLLYTVRQFLSILEGSKAEPVYAALCSKLTLALNEIGIRSRVNKKRVHEYMKLPPALQAVASDAK